jgi:dTDP-glucose pyrophosphorylase
LDQFEDEAAIVIGVTDSVDPSFGYVATDDLSRVIDVAEKRPISQLALAGFYAFSSSEEFLKLGHLTDSRSLRKEIFFSDLLRTAISCGLRISMVRLKYHYSCGTPQHFEILREHFSRDVF